MKTLALVATAAVSITALVMTSGTDDQAAYNDHVISIQHDLEVLAPNKSQFCHRGATLILLGRYDQAEQYMEDFGTCIRGLVEDATLLQQ